MADTNKIEPAAYTIEIPDGLFVAKTRAAIVNVVANTEFEDVDIRPLYDESALEAARQTALAGRADNSLATVKALLDERDELRVKLAIATAVLETVRANLWRMSSGSPTQDVINEALAKIKGDE